MNHHKFFSNSNITHYQINEVLSRVNNPVDVDKNQVYNQIGIRSHAKGIFFKEPVSGKELGDKRVFWVVPNCFIVNIVFAWERAIAQTTEEHRGYIASHRFPMYKANEELVDLNYITFLFKTKKGQYLLELASPGGAGRNKTLGQSEFGKLEVALPSLNSQKKIVKLLLLLDKKNRKQKEKVEELEQFKKGMMQKILSHKLRFEDEDSAEFPEWEIKTINELAVSLDNQRRPLNSSDRLEMKGDIPYYGANGIVDYIDRYLFDEELILLAEDGGQFDEFADRPIAQYISGKSWVNNHAHILKAINCNNKMLYYLLVHKDIRKYINGTSRAKLNKESMLQIEVNIPKSLEEQTKIVKYLSAIDLKIKKEKEKLMVLEEQKKGFMWGMFV